jgi:glycosyltransferase involved in cell wall biosynthesis
MLKYVLITPAYNEAEYLGLTAESVVRQTVVPECWVIVSDGSTDGTDALAQHYAAAYHWIRYIRLERSDGYSFARKAHSFNAGYLCVQSLTFDLVGNLDADVSLEPDYFEYLMARFSEDDRLGVAGTPMIEPGHDPVADGLFNETDVFGACQVFRRDCFAQIGGYVPIKAGGVDWVALRTARMLGWKTRSFLGKRFVHHRPMGLRKGGGLIAKFHHGQKDYFLGNHPLWQMSRVAYQATRRPLVVGGAFLLLGYLWAALRRTPRVVSPELLRFHRSEQMDRLRRAVRGRIAPFAGARGLHR